MTSKAKKMAMGLIGVATMLSSCANMGSGPQGGPKDVTAPKYMGSTPKPNQTNFDGKKVVLTFDEYVQLKDAYNRVMVTPPQKTSPSISSLGKKVTVELMDTLKENTTYTIDFGNSIVDLNESNELKGYTIQFSTGDHIDSMKISGKVLNAENLAPMKGVYVGAYANGVDSMLRTRPFDHVAKTDENGNFTIKGLPKQSYKIYALKDDNSNYKYDQKSEGVAFIGQTYIPTMEETTRIDTIYKDSVDEKGKSLGMKSTEIDTIKEEKYNRFGPDTLLLMYSVKTVHLQSLKSVKREDRNKICVYMVNDKKEAPKMSIVDNQTKDWYVTEKSVTGDTTTFWICDTTVAKMDTLKVAVEYEKTDSAENFVAMVDTFSLTSPKEKKKKTREKIEFDMPKIVETYANPVMTWKRPLTRLDKSMMAVQKKQDSTWTDVEYELKETANPRKYELEMKLSETDVYRVKIDSGVAKNIYGQENNVELTKTFKLRKSEEYTKLTMKIKGAPQNSIVELLNPNDVAVRKAELKGETVVFENLFAGDYYLRLTEDTDNDGKWTPGDFDKQQLPENVYYSNKKYTLRANWEREEEWDVNSTPLTSQRPAGLKVKEIKNKKK